MRTSEFIQLAISCLIIASFIVGIIGILYFIYFFIQKKRHKDISLNKRKLLSTGLLLGYIVVVIFATILLERISHSWNSRIHLDLFSSYIYAWNHFEMREWRNIILNILMFVPLGVILPTYHYVFKKWWVTYLTGFGLTLFIEVTQWITRRGIFEIDDIINNVVGCMIGFGIWAILYFIYQKIKHQETKSLFLIFKQIPLIITIIVFSVIFITYYQKDLGNIERHYYQRVDMTNIKLTNEAQLSTVSPQAYVYQTKVYSEEECYKIAKYYFDKANLTIDDTLTGRYDDTIIYYSQDRNMSIWIDYIGRTFSVHFPRDMENEDNYQEDLSLNQVKNLLSLYNIQVPKDVTFEDVGEGYYRLNVYRQIIDGNYVNGEISCIVTKDMQLEEISYNLKTYTPFKEYQIKSSDEAFEEVKKGYFNQDYLENVGDEITIKKVRLAYVEDTKGFMQPIYEFLTNGNGIIYIPAI